MCKSFEKRKRIWMIVMQLCCALLLLNDAFAWFYRGVPGSYASWIVHISNFGVFFFSDIMLFCFHGFMCICLFGTAKVGLLQKKRQKLIYKESTLHINQVDWRIAAVYMIALIGAFFVVISQFTGWYYFIDSVNVYHRQSGYYLAMGIPILGMLIDFSVVISCRRKLDRFLLVSLLSYMLLPFIAMVVLLFYYGISLVNIAISISMILMFVITMVEQSRIIAVSERTAADLKIQLMLSQIAPHFIYNTLTTISQMCEMDPGLAKETTIEFSKYLRGNMDSLNHKECIPFQMELDHTRYYTNIEKKRFGDRIQVIYDITDSNFLIPSLTLQPLVENAIKHGLCKKKGGGTVTIRTEHKNGTYYVSVTDDGTGFDINKMPEEGHIGIKNVTERLERMCDGTLTIDSSSGKGTTAVIAIPDRSMFDKGMES